MSTKQIYRVILYKTKRNTDICKLLKIYFPSFALTDTAYQSLAKENRDQCILISGKKSHFYSFYIDIGFCIISVTF